MANGTSGTFEVPTDSTAVSFPHVDTTESPNSASLTAPAPAESGLGGQALSLQPSQPAPVQPAQQEEHPAATAARGVFAALSGSTGHPMDWARATIAGGLAAAANVGQAPKGGGFLYGLARGAGGAQQEIDKQNAIAQQQKQQQFENQEKLKADERQQAQLQNELQNSTAQRALYTAQTAGAIQTQQQSAARFKDLSAEDKLRVQELNNKLRESEADNLAILSAANVDVTTLKHITNQDQLNESDAKQGGSGQVFAVANGKDHKEGEDDAGAYVVPGDIWDKKTAKDVTITTGWNVDPKTGKETPIQHTASAGTPVSDLLAIAKGAHNDLMAKQKAILDQASAQEGIAKGANAQTDEALKQQQTRAQTAHENAETEQVKSQTVQNPPGSEGLTGEAFRNTLPTATQLTFKAISEGREKGLNLQDRKGNLTPVGQQFVRAYPDADMGKIADYPKAVHEFQEGQTGKDLVAMGTGINHLRAAYDNTGAASYIPGTAENKRYNADTTFVSEELGKYLKGGVATKDEVEHIQDAIKSNIPWVRKGALENAAHIINGRSSELEQRWKNAQPSPSYQPAMPNISQEAKDNLAYVQSSGKRPNAAAAPPPPQGATMKVPGSDGKLYWSDGKNNLGVVGAS
jgi:hypothetical protein